jgi:hypothetical protein
MQEYPLTACAGTEIYSGAPSDRQGGLDHACNLSGLPWGARTQLEQDNDDFPA